MKDYILHHLCEESSTLHHRTDYAALPSQKMYLSAFYNLFKSIKNFGILKNIQTYITKILLRIGIDSSVVLRLLKDQ